MGDFDFMEGPREPNFNLGFAESGAGGWWDYHRERQGFNRPFDRSPVQTPSGWYGGQVDQTGGMVMVRTWATFPMDQWGLVHDRRPGREHEYEVAYGDNPGVSLQRYVWRGNQFSDGKGAYDYDGEVESRSVRPNTDQVEARAALELMRKHSNLTR